MSTNCFCKLAAVAVKEVLLVARVVLLFASAANISFSVVAAFASELKYIEVQKLRNTKASSDRSPTWSKPANTNFWVMDKP